MVMGRHHQNQSRQNGDRPQEDVLASFELLHLADGLLRLT